MNITHDFHAIKIKIATLGDRIQNMKMNMHNDFKNMMILNMGCFLASVDM